MLSYGSTFADIVTDVVASTVSVEALRISSVKVHCLVPTPDLVTLHVRVELSASHVAVVPLVSVPVTSVTRDS
jgi:hypothetical protein